MNDKIENFLNKFDLESQDWSVYEFYWGSAVKNTEKDKWIRAFVKPRAQEINLENIGVEVHENGIEFLER